jgi:hypothetical protein
MDFSWLLLDVFSPDGIGILFVRFFDEQKDYFTILLFLFVFSKFHFSGQREIAPENQVIKIRKNL